MQHCGFFILHKVQYILYMTALKDEHSSVNSYSITWSYMRMIIGTSIIWVGVGWGWGYTTHTNLGRRLRLGLVSLYVMLPLTPTSQTPCNAILTNTFEFLTSRGRDGQLCGLNGLSNRPLSLKVLRFLGFVIYVNIIYSSWRLLPVSLTEIQWNPLGKIFQSSAIDRMGNEWDGGFDNRCIGYKNLLLAVDRYMFFACIYSFSSHIILEHSLRIVKF